jgi:hypothetical protein
MKTIQLFILILLASLLSSCLENHKKPIINIENGKVGMIGYGSLISKQSMESTLLRKYQDSVYLVHLEGFQREWNFVWSNYDTSYSEDDLKYDGFYIREKDTIPFEKIIFLNIMAQKESSMNCVLYFIAPEELIGFDKRELGYERIDVTNLIKEYNFQGGKVYAYKATPNYIYDSDSDYKNSIIEKSYINLVTEACDSIGSYYRQEYEASTKPFDPDLLADKIIWKKVR